jgi:casein kinase II subunit beta
LNNEVANYQQALDLITDNMGCVFKFPFLSISFLPLNGSPLDDDIQDELRGSLDVQARLLYGLIHARWIITARGLNKMVFIFKKSKCWFNFFLLSLSA